MSARAVFFRAVSVSISVIALLSARAASGQMLISGRVWTPRTVLDAGELPPETGIIEDYFGGGRRPVPEGIVGLSNVRCVATRAGEDAQSLGLITWSTEPTGWYRLSGPEGRYTLLFTGIDMPPRPLILTNVHLTGRDRLDLKVVPPFDYYVLDERAYDTKAARGYYQTFVCRGTSITHVSFRLVHDGVDGMGPGSQTLAVSIHKPGAGPPEDWPQVGPTALVPRVDSGGPKNYDWTAAWNSGEVAVTPGETYAVYLRPEATNGKLQAFWRPDPNKGIAGDCYRVASAPAGDSASAGAGGSAAGASSGWQHRDLYMVVSSDSDGLVIPYNKRIQQQYGPFAGFARRWSQTYVAKGRGLAGVMLYAATGGSQPGIHRQRVRFRVREGGPDGPQVGISKIGIGTGIHTGDAAWGTFGAAIAPGEINLKPGRTYAIEAESIENYESLHGYVNIKGVPSDEKPGFNPYRKMEPDSCPDGTAYKHGAQDAGFDLDMQIIEYEHAGSDWGEAVVATNLLGNGDMESGTFDAGQPTAGAPEAWQRFEIATDASGERPAAAPGVYQYVTEGPAHANRLLRLACVKDKAGPFDAGYVQRVGKLTRRETYRLRGRVRSSFGVDFEHACWVGVDLTGQIGDPNAATIHWTALPFTHSLWTDYASEPLRPAGDALSVWLRAATRSRNEPDYRGDFDDFALEQVRSDRPGPQDEKLRGQK